MATEFNSLGRKLSLQTLRMQYRRPVAETVRACYLLFSIEGRAGGDAAGQEDGEKLQRVLVFISILLSLPRRKSRFLAIFVMTLAL